MCSYGMEMSSIVVYNHWNLRVYTIAEWKQRFWQCCTNWAIIHITTRYLTADSNVFSKEVFTKPLVPLTLLLFHPPGPRGLLVLRRRAPTEILHTQQRVWLCMLSCENKWGLCAWERAITCVCVCLCVCVYVCARMFEIVLNRYIHAYVSVCVCTCGCVCERKSVSYPRDIGRNLVHLEHFSTRVCGYVCLCECVCVRERVSKFVCVCDTREIYRILTIWDERRAPTLGVIVFWLYCEFGLTTTWWWSHLRVRVCLCAILCLCVYWCCTGKVPCTCGYVWRTRMCSHPGCCQNKNQPDHTCTHCSV